MVENVVVREREDVKPRGTEERGPLHRRQERRRHDRVTAPVRLAVEERDLEVPENNVRVGEARAHAFEGITIAPGAQRFQDPSVESDVPDRLESDLAHEPHLTGYAQALARPLHLAPGVFLASPSAVPPPWRREDTVAGRG